MVSPPPHLQQWAGSGPQTPPRRVSRHYHSQEGWHTTTKDYAYGDTTLCDKGTHYDDEYHEEVHSADDSDYEDHELFHAAEGAPSRHAPENHPYHELNNAFVLGASSDEADKDNGVPFLDSDEMAEHFYAWVMGRKSDSNPAVSVRHPNSPRFRATPVMVHTTTIKTPMTAIPTIPTSTPTSLLPASTPQLVDRPRDSPLPKRKC